MWDQKDFEIGGLVVVQMMKQDVLASKHRIPVFGVLRCLADASGLAAVDGILQKSKMNSALDAQTLISRTEHPWEQSSQEMEESQRPLSQYRILEAVKSEKLRADLTMRRASRGQLRGQSPS